MVVFKRGLGVLVVALVGIVLASDTDEDMGPKVRTKRYLDDRYSSWRYGASSPPFYGYASSYSFPYRSYIKRGLGSARNARYGTWRYQNPAEPQQKRGLGAARNVPYVNYNDWDFVGADNYWPLNMDYDNDKRFLGPAPDVRYRQFGSPFYVDPPGVAKHRYRRDLGEISENEAEEGLEDPKEKRYLGIALYPSKIASKQRYQKPSGKKRAWEAVPDFEQLVNDPGTYMDTPLEDALNQENAAKRHIGSAMNLKQVSPVQIDDSKRHIGAAFGAGYLPRFLQKGGSELDSMEQDKRSSESDIDYGQPPVYDLPGQGEKRHLGAALRLRQSSSVDSANQEEKRHLGAALRLKQPSSGDSASQQDKRHLGAALRLKQSSSGDSASQQDKRHLGVALRLKQPSSSDSASQPEKRHLGAALRLRQPPSAESASQPEKRHLGAALRLRQPSRYDSSGEKRHIGAARNHAFDGNVMHLPSTPEVKPVANEWYGTYNSLFDDFFKQMRRALRSEPDQIQDGGDDTFLETNGQNMPKPRVRRHLASLVASRISPFPSMTKYKQSYYLKPLDHNRGYVDENNTADSGEKAKAKYFNFMALLMRYQLKNFLKTMD